MTSTSYKTGTAIATNGSTAVTGSGTAWATWIKAGDTFFAQGLGIEVASVTDNTHLVLAENWPGTTMSGGAYRIAYGADVARVVEAARKAVEALKIPQTGIPMVWDGSATTDANPGAGLVRGNSASSPTVLYISKTAGDSAGSDISTLLAAIDDVSNAISRAELSFRPTDGADAFLNFKVTGAITDATGYVKVPVALRSGAVPADAAALAMAWVPAGADSIFTAIASQAEAQAGTDNTKGMTPLRTLQAMQKYGIGGITSLAAPDLNAALATGFYFCSSPTNGPSQNGWLTVHDLTTTADYVAQEYIDVNGLWWARNKIGGVWGSWTRVANKVVGTVSQSSGTPTGAVIEQGSNANGSYTRWADGTQICWGSLVFTSQASGTSMAGGFRTSGVSFTWPATFGAAPGITLTPGTSLNAIGGGIGSSSTTGASLVATTVTSQPAANITLSYLAIGRWF